MPNEIENFDKMSGNLIQVVTNTKLPQGAEKEDSVNMCKAIEDMMKDAVEEETFETAKRFFETGGTLETALKVFPSLSEEVLISIKEGI